MFGWDDTGPNGDYDPAYMVSRRIRHMWLYEWAVSAGTVVTVNSSPTRSSKVNRALGGWNIGHWELALNADATVYNFELKASLGNHEGNVNFSLNRTDLSYIHQLSGRWGCGSGHTIYNRLVYNKRLDKWAQVCWLDGNGDGGPAYPPQTGMYSTVVNFVNGSGEEGPAEIQKLSGGDTWRMGGPGAIISMGADGFIVAATESALNSGPPASERFPPRGPELYHNIPQCPIWMPAHTCDAVGLLKVPAEGSAYFQEHRDDPEFQWNWFTERESTVGGGGGYPGGDRRVGLANAANFGLGGEDAAEVLVGWSEHVRSIFQSGISDHYVVSRADRTGRLVGEPWSLQVAPSTADRVLLLFLYFSSSSSSSPSSPFVSRLIDICCLI